MSAFAAQILVRLDAHAHDSLQAQLCAGLRRAIRAGVLRPGTRLPSSRALAADLRISRTTAVLAYDQLIAEGVLATRAGSGMFVASVPSDRGSLPASPGAGAPWRTPPCRGAARPWPRCRPSPGSSVAPRDRSASGRRRSICCRCMPGRVRDPAPESHHARAARFRDPPASCRCAPPSPSTCGACAARRAPPTRSSSSPAPSTASS